MSGKRLLVVGDMVWGMADVTTPYVGQIVDQTASDPPQTTAMESATSQREGEHAEFVKASHISRTI